MSRPDEFGTGRSRLRACGTVDSRRLTTPTSSPSSSPTELAVTWTSRSTTEGEVDRPGGPHPEAAPRWRRKSRPHGPAVALKIDERAWN